MSKKFIMGLLSSLLLLILLPNLANAKEFEAELSNNLEKIELDEAEIEKRKAEVEAAMIKSFGETGNVDESLEELGLEKLEVKTEPQYGLFSKGTDATVSSSYYRDRFSGQYLVRGAWKWNCSDCYDTWDTTPIDALGVWLSNVSNGKPATGQSFDSAGSAVYDTNGNLYVNNMWQSDFDPANAGVAWAISDSFVAGSSMKNYIGHSGQGWIWMSKAPTNEVYLRVKYVHTWSSGSLSNISIGTSGLTFTPGSSTKSFEQTNPITKISSWPSN